MKLYLYCLLCICLLCIFNDIHCDREFEPFIANQDLKFYPGVNEYRIFDTDDNISMNNVSGTKLVVGPHRINSYSSGFVQSILQSNDNNSQSDFEFTNPLIDKKGQFKSWIGQFNNYKDLFSKNDIMSENDGSGEKKYLLDEKNNNKLMPIDPLYPYPHPKMKHLSKNQIPFNFTHQLYMNSFRNQFRNNIVYDSKNERGPYNFDDLLLCDDIQCPLGYKKDPLKLQSSPFGYDKDSDPLIQSMVGINYCCKKSSLL